MNSSRLPRYNTKLSKEKKQKTKIEDHAEVSGARGDLACGSPGDKVGELLAVRPLKLPGQTAHNTGTTAPAFPTSLCEASPQVPIPKLSLHPPLSFGKTPSPLGTALPKPCGSHSPLSPSSRPKGLPVEWLLTVSSTVLGRAGPMQQSFRQPGPLLAPAAPGWEPEAGDPLLKILAKRPFRRCN